MDYIACVDGDDHGWRRVFHYGDWLALDSPYAGDDQVKGGTDEGFIADVYYRKSLSIVAQTAEILGKQEEKERYARKAEEVLDGLKKEYYSGTGRCCIFTQTAAILTLHEHLDDEKRALEQLLTLLRYRQGMLSTGFIGTPLLCETLSACGHEKKAYQLLLNEEYPGWLGEIRQGATTVWERWNSLDETGHISSTGMNSLNHYAYGSVVAWLWNGCAGLRPLAQEPGFRKVRIEPKVNYKLQRVDAVYDSPAGTYRIFWEIIGKETIHLKLTVPAGCEAVVKLPCSDAEEFLVRGDYEVSYRANQPLVNAFTADSVLQEMLCDPDARRVLRREVPKLNSYLAFGRDYPLRETMDNKGDDSPELYRRLNEALKDAAGSLENYVP